MTPARPPIIVVGSCEAIMGWDDADPSPDRCGELAVATSLTNRDAGLRCAKHPEDPRFGDDPSPLASRLTRGVARLAAAQA